MRAHSTRGRTRRCFAGAIGIMSIALAGCTAVRATPSVPVILPGFSRPTPVLCYDGPDAPTPKPAECVIPTDSLVPPFSLPTGRGVPGPADNISLPAGLATLPPVIPWHGRTFYTPPSGSGAQLMGIGPDDTIYILLERPLPLPTPTPNVAFFVPDVEASVIALRPDGSTKPGWPTAGVPVAGFPMSYKVNEEGTVFVASGPNLYLAGANTQTQLTITAIGSDGRVVSGWPYRTPAAQQYLAPELLVPGPGGTVCFLQVKPGVAPGPDLPMLVYCLGRDGKLLPGWPYSSVMPLGSMAVGPDGPLYVAQKTSTKTTTNKYVYPYQVLAIGPDGKPKSGWVAWSRDGADGITAIVPTRDGRVYLLLGGDGGRAELIDLDGTGKTLEGHVELASSLSDPNYKDAVLTSDGSLFVSATDQNNVIVDVVNAYSANGSQMSGWPQLIGGWGDLAVAPQGSVWVAWTVYGAGGGSDETSVVALFDKNGKLQPGYPMAADYLISLGMTYGLQVASDGTAYGTAASASGSRIVTFGR